MMLKELVKKIDSAIPSLFPVDPAQFNDPVALQTEWKAVRTSRSGASSNKLIQKDANLLAYKPSLMGRIMGIIFALAGASVIAVFFTMTDDVQAIFLLVVGLIFAGVGVLIFFQASTPVAFDKSVGMFYKGRKQQRLADAADVKRTARFSDIHAIQMIARLESSSDNNNNTPTRFYTVFDMNLVRHNGERVFVTTYGKAERAREDARMIAEFINVPVWDGIDG